MQEEKWYKWISHLAGADRKVRDAQGWFWNDEGVAGTERPWTLSP